MYFKHNDMESLRNTLEKITLKNQRAKKLRRYIVVEAVYQVSQSIKCIKFHLINYCFYISGKTKMQFKSKGYFRN